MGFPETVQIVFKSCDQGLQLHHGVSSQCVPRPHCARLLALFGSTRSMRSMMFREEKVEGKTMMFRLAILMETTGW